MSIVVGLTRQLSSRSLDVVRAMLRERGLSVSADADLIDSAEPASDNLRPILTTLAHQMRDHDAVVVTLANPWQWSGVLDGLLGPDFRLLASVDEPPEQNLMYAMTDFVVGHEQGTGAALEHAVTALLGGPQLRPDRYEHALFLAEGQSRRSAGLRGGVGCVLIDEVGDVIAMGTNEVPRAGGGQYWADSPDDARDLRNGVDPAWESKMALVRSVLEYTELAQGGSFGDLTSLAARFLDHLDNGGQDGRPSHDSAAQTLESLGRVVHAELAALASASRHGSAVVGSEAVVTRPPCRQCLRQLVVTGVSKVRFLGHADAARYPFHADAISIDGATPAKVQVAPFTGVTPRGYDKTYGNRRTRPLALGSALAGAGDLTAVALLGALVNAT